MSPRVVLATAARVLTQLRRDPRTIAMLLLVPVRRVRSPSACAARSTSARRSGGP